MSYRNLIGLLVTGAITGLASTASGATLAQYTFEENPAGTSTTSIGAVLLDVSGNNLHFTKGASGGTLTWSSDVAPVQPVGTTSIFSNAAGALDTPAQDLSFATNPELTVEFWYKPDITDTLRFIVDTGDGANSWALFQEVPGTNGAPAGEFNLEFSYIDNAGTVRGINTATTFSTNTANNDWTHIAVTINRNTGDIAIYFNGVEDTATAGVDENIDALTFGAKTEALRLGAINTSGSFANRAFIDDLRVSDVALLPGAGTGVGELAYNASLIPEPGSMALIGIGGLLMLVRRRC